MEVGSGFLDMTRRAIGVKHAMARYDCLGMQGLDLIQRTQPFASGIVIALSQVRVRVVIDSIPGYHQANRWDMQRSRVRCIGVAELYDVELLSLDVESVSFE